MGQLQEIGLNGELLAQFKRDSEGRELQRQLGNHTQTQSQYDPQGRLITQINRRTGTQNDQEQISRRRYSYTSRNLLYRVDEQGEKGNSSTNTTVYRYDELDRLRTVQGPNPEAFLFDPASNLLESKPPANPS